MARGARLGRGRPNKPVITSNALVQSGGTKPLVITPVRMRRQRSRGTFALMRNALAPVRPRKALIVTPPPRARRGQILLARNPAAPVTPVVNIIRPHVLVSANIVSPRRRPAGHTILARGKAAPASSLDDMTFTFGDLESKWGFQMLTQRVSSLSRERVQIAVRADSDGLPYNPMAATPEMAFLGSSLAEPVAGDWKACNWDVTRLGTYVMQCMVGPGGTVNLAKGSYYAWARLTDAASGEQPVAQVTRLFVD